MKTAQWRILFFACFMPFALAHGQETCLSAATSYTLTDLGDLGGGNSQGLAINSFGQVAGQSRTSTGATHAFLWTAAVGMLDLGSLGGTYSVGFGINDAGNVVGYSKLSNGVEHAFLWTLNGGMRDLGTLGTGAENSRALGIDDHGHVIGESFLPGNPHVDHAVVWTANGIHDLGTLLPGDYSEADGINDKFQIVGHSGTTAFVWTKNAGMQALPGRNFNFAFALNNFGMAVGQTWDGVEGHPEQAVLWPGLVNLGSLGGDYAYATAINDHCQIVGVAAPGIGNPAGFIWTYNSGLQDLNALVVPPPVNSVGAANGINNKGQIAGNGGPHAILLNPSSPNP
jgi:probable HAF family extracellular repeat protein